MWEIDRRSFVSTTSVYLSWIFVGALPGPLIWPWMIMWLLVFWRKDKIAELFIGFWLVLILSDSLENGLAWAKTFKNIYILFLGFVLIVDREQFKPFNRIFMRFLPFFAVALIALMFSPVAGDGAMRTLSYFLIFLVAPNYVQRLFRERGPEIFKDLVFFGFMILVIGVAYRFIDISIAYSHGGRLRGIFGNPNGLGLFIIVLFMLFYVSNQLFKGLFSRVDRITVYGVVIFCVIFSASRNAMISLSLFLLFVRFFKVSFGLGFVALVVGLAAYQVISANIIPIVLYLGLEEFLRIETLAEGSGRLIAWQFAWLNIQDNFLLGRGFSYDLHLMQSNYDWLSRAGHEGGVHNSYLILWLNTGLIGIIFYFRAMLLLFLKAAKRTPVAVPVMVAAFFSIFFEPWLAASLNPYTIVFLITLTIVTSDEIVPVLDEDEDEDEVVEGIEEASSQNLAQA